MTPTFASELFRDYLSTAAAVTAGVPTNNQVTKQALSDAKVARPPRLIVAATHEPTDQPSQRKTVMLCSLMLTCETKAGNRAQAENWMRATREFLTDRTAFAAWVQANRTEQQRTGWQIQKLRVFPAEEDFESDDEEKTFTLVLPLRLALRLY